MQKHLNIRDKKIVALLEAAERYNGREVMNENEEDADVGSDSGDETDAELYWLWNVWACLGEFLCRSIRKSKLYTNMYLNICFKFSFWRAEVAWFFVIAKDQCAHQNCYFGCTAMYNL